MPDLISSIRKASGRVLRKGTNSRDTTVIAKRSRILNDRSSFHVKEAYKALRTNIVFAIPHDSSKKIILTSSLASEGKSTNCLNIAISFAQTGAKVVLIDCDLRKPNVANLLNIKSSPGLSNVLANLNTIDSVIVHTEYSNLDVVPSGDLPPNPSELLGSRAMKDNLDKLSEIYDYIFMDSPPVNIVTDTAVMCEMVDGVLFVVRQGQTDKESVSDAIKKLRFVNANMLGFVLNGRLTDSKAGYGNGVRRYYRYGKKRKYYSPEYFNYMGRYANYGDYSDYGYGKEYGDSRISGVFSDDKDVNTKSRKAGNKK